MQTTDSFMVLPPLLFTSLQTILPFLPPSAYFTSAREQTLHLLEPTNLPLFICTTLAVLGESAGAGTGFGAVFCQF